jgi:hypothetical protein
MSSPSISSLCRSVNEAICIAGLVCLLIAYVYLGVHLLVISPYNLEMWLSLLQLVVSFNNQHFWIRTWCPPKPALATTWGGGTASDQAKMTARSTTTPLNENTDNEWSHILAELSYDQIGIKPSSHRLSFSHNSIHICKYKKMTIKNLITYFDCRFKLTQISAPIFSEWKNCWLFWRKKT